MQQRTRLTIAFGALAASAVALAASAGGPAAGGAKVAVVTVTAGEPLELAFKLSKFSLLPVGKVTFKVTNKGVLTHDFKVCTKPVTSSKLNTCTGTGTKKLGAGEA